MSKSKKSSKRTASIPNKAIYSRLSYLYQAATYLATTHSQEKVITDSKCGKKCTISDDKSQGPSNLENIIDISPLKLARSRRLIAEFRNISLKTQIRISPYLKHSICKTCFTLLICGSTCSNEIENKSKGGQKPWADVLVRKCHVCNTVKRFPLAAPRQKRRAVRQTQDKNIEMKQG